MFKNFLSRACELISYESHKKPLVEVDYEFAHLVLKFLRNLKIPDIKPFPRAMCPTGNELKGFTVARDGSASGLGVLCYAITEGKSGETCRVTWGKN